MDAENRMVSRNETERAESGAMYYDRCQEVYGQKLCIRDLST